MGRVRRVVGAWRRRESRQVIRLVGEEGMEQRRLWRLHPLHEERDGSLGDLARKLAESVSGLNLPGDDVGWMLHLGRERFEDDPGIVLFCANEVIFYGIDDVDRCHDAD